VRRDFDMAASVSLGSGGRLVIVRFNPDAFRISGVTCPAAKKERHAKLLVLLGQLQTREPELRLSRLFLFYDRDAQDSLLPLVAEQWDNDVARMISKIVA
jgi:hypothetical protein